MSNVINIDFSGSDEFKHCGYYEVGNDVGLAMLDKSIIVLPCNVNQIEVAMGGESKLYSREELAEFINVLKVFLDSQDKFMPQLEMVGLNYK